MTDHLRPLTARKQSFSEEGGKELEATWNEVGSLYRKRRFRVHHGRPGEAQAVVSGGA